MDAVQALPDQSLTAMRRVVFLLSLLSLLGAGFILYSTAVAPWGYSDATAYINAARNLLAGHGLGVLQTSGDFVPLTLHPPLYPLALSALGLLGLDLIDAARWLNVFIFAALIFSTGFLTYKITHSSRLACLVSLFTLLMPGLVRAYTGIMTEPLHHALVIGSLLLLALYLADGQRGAWIGSAVLAGLAFTTRYTGFAVILAGVLGIALLESAPLKRRLIHVVLYGMVGVLPQVLWTSWTWLRYGALPIDAPGQSVSLWARITPFRFALADHLILWLPFADKLPLSEEYNSQKAMISLILLVALFAIGLIAWKSRGNRKTARGMRTAGVFGIYTAAFTVFYMLAYAYNNPQPDLDNRLLYPIYIGLIYGGLFVGWSSTQVWRTSKVLRVALVLVGGIVLVSYLPYDLGLAAELHAKGEGYTSLAQQRSETIALLKELPPDIPLVSNEPSIVHLLVGRSTYSLFELTGEKGSSLPVEKGRELQEAERTRLREEDAVLVLFYNLIYQYRLLYGSAAEDMMISLVDGLYLYQTTADGSIYFSEEPAGLLRGAP